MRKYLLGLCMLSAGLVATAQDEISEEKTVDVFQEVVYYDGYQPVVVDADVEDGILRFKNSLYSKKLSIEEFSDLGDELTLNVIIGALCDNYDRISALCLAFVPKGSESYEYDAVKRIEIARLITPFMNKNRKPFEVPYEYDIPNVAKILKDVDINSEYDLWLEFEIFGVPYAANEQVSGCKNRNDVFAGTASFSFVPESETVPEQGNVVVPIFVKAQEDRGNINFNNYNENATDTIGVTTRTFHFTVPEDVADSKIYLILTNHGAGTNGEEYVRREHLVYYDGDIKLVYTPGGVSCEPYRQYNTQSNGIYSNSERSDAFWERRSNWCPGQAVPIREIDLGAQKAGEHSVMIRVPDAVFYGKDGDFRPSLYFHGVKEGVMPASVDQIWFDAPEVSIVYDGENIIINSAELLTELRIYDYNGTLRRLTDISSTNVVSCKDLQKGAYIITVTTPEGRKGVKKLII